MTNIIMKYKSIFLCLGVLFMVSCDEQLDLAPISSVANNAYFQNAAQVEAGVIAIYDGLQNVPIREFAITEMRSDNTRTKSSEGDWAQFQDLDVATTNSVVTTYWAANYNVIFRANLVLANLDIVTGSDKSQFEGEAKFTRALALFNLVRAYGDVPIVDKVIIQTDTDYFDRDPVSAVYDAIQADLVDAASLLSGGSADRATAGAANALLAKVRLTIGDYPGALSLLTPLATGTTYSLEDNYADVFYKEMGSEIVFAIPYLDDAGDQLGGGDSQDFSFEFTAGGRVSGLNFPTPELKAAIDPADTERFPVLFRPVIIPTEGGKFVTTSSNSRQCGNDWIVLRYADVLLMHAEAIMGTSTSTNDTGAIGSYNRVRDRVGLPTIGPGGELTKDMLLNERRIELAYENHRFYDLIRFNAANTVLADFAADNGYNFTPTDLLLPIPQNEINVSGGLLTQNPGY